ncbi:hypothetical protein E2C01_008267 [Portunus trituberculatus]|uniref:Uncharacterized protein n=1 Tax=Portunus trituberculatus TaxID=210409 RepID=A0A5B7D2C5_PORTR|nr:hypothetical protein [Portunus trituberculatus]
MQIMALGQFSAQALARLATMEALVLNRSSRVMPGLRGTPAGITTTSQPFRESCHRDFNDLGHTVVSQSSRQP